MRTSSRSRRPKRLPALLAAAALGAAAGHAAGQAAPAAPKKLSFADPGVFDLSAVRLWRLPGDRPAVPVASLAPNLARGILTAQPRPDDAPERLRVSEATPDAAREAEGKRLAAEAPAVRRDGSSLVVAPASGTPILFRDLRMPVKPGEPPAATTYNHLGRVGAARYHRVEVRPPSEPAGSFLVNPVDGKTVHVKEGVDTVSLSPGGLRLLSYNDIALPFALTLTSLAATGPVVDVACKATGSGKAWALVKGWRGDDTVDLVVSFGERGRGEKVPVRFERTKAGWRLGTEDERRLGSPEGLACVAGPIPKPLM